MENTENIYFEEENIDIKKFLFRILKNWYWFAISLFITITVAYLINRYSEPIYSISSTIVVRDDSKGKGLSGAEQMLDGMEMFRSRKNVYNEIGLLQSYKLCNRTLKELDDFEISYIKVGRRGIKEAKLYNKSPFVVHYDTSKVQQRGHPAYVSIISHDKYLLEIDEGMSINKEMYFGEQLEHESFNFNITLRNPEYFELEENTSNRYYFVINDLNSLTNLYKGKLGITVNDKKGSILTLAISGYVAEQEADYLNKLSEVYILDGLEVKNKTAEKTINFIDSQLSNIIDSLNVAEDDLQNFRTQNQVIDISKEGQAIYERLGSYQDEQVMLKINLSYYEYLLDYISSKNNYSDVIVPSIMGISDPVLSATVNKLSQLNSEKTNLQFTVTETNSSMELLNSQIYATRAELIENIKNLIENTKNTLNEVGKNIIVIEKNLRSLPGTERQLIQIQRMFNLNNEIYNYLLEKRSEAAIARASNIADNRILDYAISENAAKISPKSSLNYMVALVLGLMFPVIIILLLDFFNNKIIDKKDIENHTKVPILGGIGHNNFREDAPLILNPKSSLAESFRSLRTNIQYMGIESKVKIIMVSSTISGEGKTFCATNLATIFSMSGKKTLLMGLDMRKPKIHKVFNISNDKGISSFLIGQDSFQDIIHPTSQENLFVAPSGPVPPNPAELIETEKMKSLMELVKNEFDTIILDTPPVAIVTDPILLARFSDVNIFIVRQNYSNKNVVQLIDDLQHRIKFKKLGILINDIKLNGYFGYGYNYGYGYGYGYGYDQDYYGEDGGKSKFRRVLDSFKGVKS